MTRLSATNVRTVSVGPRFFDTAGVQVVSGREFSWADAEGGTAVAIINETFAREHFDAKGPLGRNVVLGEGFGPAVTVIGVVADGPAHTIGLRLPVRPTLYLSALQYEPDHVEVIVRSWEEDRGSLVEAVRSAGLFPMSPVETLAERISSRLQPLDWLLGMVTVVSVFGLVVSGFGIYAVLGNLTRIRRRELAVRLAVGATSFGVSWMTLRWAVSVVLWGLMIGTMFGMGAVAKIQVLVPSAPLVQPGLLSLSWTLLFATGLVGALVPVLRSLRIAPAEVLRDDRA